MSRDPHFQELLMRRGRTREIAHAAGVSRQAVWAWDRIPAERAMEISKAIGLELWELRPDLWQNPSKGSNS